MKKKGYSHGLVAGIICDSKLVAWLKCQVPISEHSRGSSLYHLEELGIKGG